MNTAYPLFPVILITLLAYATTRIFTAWGIFRLANHRKFWNYLLLLTFLVSGMLGVLSVIKVNYKLEIPSYETYLQFHVSFGIAMVLIAFFHLSWHLKYYVSFRKKITKVSVKPGKTVDSGTSYYHVLLFFLGMVTILNQVVFIREFISVLSGNELVVGVLIASWMLITGWGALHARKGNVEGFSFKKGFRMLGALAIMPPVMIFLLYLLKDQLFPPGTLISFYHTLIAVFILLFPVCFLSGYLFTFFSSSYSTSENKNLIGRAYSIESLGSLLGGILFTLLLGRLLTSFQVFGIISCILFLTTAWYIRKSGSGRFWVWILPGLLIPLLIFIFNPDNAVKQLSYPNQELIENQSTRYGNVVITRQAGQTNVYENNTLQFYTENTMMNEEAVHFAMIQHPDPKSVLLISGGMAGMVNEILKYDVDHITYLESNPELFRIASDIYKLFTGEEKVEVIRKDIRTFIGSTDRVFDVILINLPPPSSLSLNRFYTEEFFQLVKIHCSEQSILCTSLSSTSNYAEENALDVNASLWKTLGKSFSSRMIVQGEKNYFLASDAMLHKEITVRMAEKKIPTEYVNLYYLDDMLLSMRSEALTREFSDDVAVNRDFYPYMFIKEIGHWLNYQGTKYYLLILIPGILFLLLFFRTNRITAGLYTGGFTAASLEVILLLAYQVYFGSIYIATALFFAIFMAGLAFGSSGRYKNRFTPQRNYYLIQFILAAFAMLLPLLILLAGKLSASEFPAQVVFLLLIFILAAGIGYEFLLASEMRQKSYVDTSAVNYSTDLAGSAFGAFLTAIVLLPLLGVFYTCLIVAGLNLLSGTLAFSIRKAFNIS
ncbi:hypothetical protein ACFLT1_03165 [Bacteroidota bacterium]